MEPEGVVEAPAEAEGEAQAEESQPEEARPRLCYSKHFCEECIIFQFMLMILVMIFNGFGYGF